jgi:hypothetical protein
LGNATVNPVDKILLDSDSEMSDENLEDNDPKKPWLSEFCRYLNTHDVIPDSTTVVKWWGVRIQYF